MKEFLWRVIAFAIQKSTKSSISSEWTKIASDISYTNNIRQINQRRGMQIATRDLVTSIKNRANSRKSVAILGSGSSLTRLTKNDLDEICLNDVWGFNFIGVYSIPFDLYFFEPSNQNDADYFETQVRSNEWLKSCPVLYNGNYVQWNEINLPQNPNTYLYHPLRLPTTSENTIKQTLFVRRLLPFSAGRVIHHSASLTALIEYAVLCGFKEIILVGIDLTGPYVFTEAPQCLIPFEPNLEGFLSRFKQNIPNSEIHNTNNPNRNNYSVPVSQFIAEYKRSILDRKGIEIKTWFKNDILNLPYIKK